jgi:hypothetical protein
MKTALVVNSNGSHEVIDIETDTLSKLQTAVDGLIQPIDLTESLTMWVNEEFLFRNSFEPNILGTAMYQTVGGEYTILGNVVFTGGVDSEGYSMGLTDYDYERLTSFAKEAERLLGLGVFN